MVITRNQSNLLLALLLSHLWLSGCVPGSKSISIVAPAPSVKQPASPQANSNASPASPSSPAVANSSSGGIDGGGGNGLDLKMIETLRRYPMKDEIFLRRIAPLIETVKKTVPNFGNSLSYVANFEPWYFVPKAPHKVVPSSRLGLGFSTEQYGFQNFLEIFIDDSVAKAMQEDALTDLYVHELAMAIYLFPFSSPLRVCHAMNYGAETPASDSPDICTLYPDPSKAKPASNLTEKDYENVRFVAKALQDPTLIGQPRKLAWLLFEHSYPKYFYRHDDAEKDPIALYWAPHSIADLGHLLLSTQATNSLPKYSGVTRENKSLGECHIQVSYTEGSAAVHITRQIVKTGTTEKVDPSIDADFYNEDFTSTITPSLNQSSWTNSVGFVLTTQTVPKPEIGNTRISLWFELDQHRGILSMKFQKDAYVSEAPDSSSSPAKFGWSGAVTNEGSDGPWYDRCLLEDPQLSDHIVH